MWLLLKMNDEHADKRRNVIKEDTSAWSGKTMQEIAAQERGDGKKESKKKPIKKKKTIQTTCKKSTSTKETRTKK